MLIIKDDFGGLDDPAFVREMRDDLDALTARAINKGHRRASQQAMRDASRYVNAPLGQPERSNPNVAFVQRATRRRLDATLALVSRVGLSLHRIRGAVQTRAGVVFQSKRRRQTRARAFFLGRDGYVFKRSDDGSRRLTMQTTRITLPDHRIAALYRHFQHEFDRALDGGLTRLLARRRPRKSL